MKKNKGAKIFSTEKGLKLFSNIERVKTFFGVMVQFSQNTDTSFPVYRIPFSAFGVMGFRPKRDGSKFMDTRAGTIDRGRGLFSK